MRVLGFCGADKVPVEITCAIGDAHPWAEDGGRALLRYDGGEVEKMPSCSSVDCWQVTPQCFIVRFSEGYPKESGYE